jgi:hypothetical protein
MSSAMNPEDARIATMKFILASFCLAEAQTSSEDHLKVGTLP